VPTLTITTPEGLHLKQEIAGAGSRYVAALLDGILLGLLWLLMLLGAMGLAELDPTGVGRFAAGLATGGILLIAVAYQFVFAGLWNGQTPGKRALRLRIKSADGHPASKFQLLMRSLLWVVDVLVLVPVSVGLYLIVLTPRHQRLGDLAAGTLVLRDPPEEAPREPYEDETWESLSPRLLPLTPALTRRLTRSDREFLRELLTRRGVADDKRTELMEAACQHYREHLFLADSVSVRDSLKELYLFLREFPPTS
jgi:uncharacterized RDD family membrane protein YckC